MLILLNKSQKFQFQNYTFQTSKRFLFCQIYIEYKNIIKLGRIVTTFQSILLSLNVIQYIFIKLMKFLLASALVGTIYAQQSFKQSADTFIVSPIFQYEDAIPIQTYQDKKMADLIPQEIDQVNIQNQQHKTPQYIGPIIESVQQHIHSGPIPGQSQFYVDQNDQDGQNKQQDVVPIFPQYPIGRDQFNPNPFIRPESQQKQFQTQENLTPIYPQQPLGREQFNPNPFVRPQLLGRQEFNTDPFIIPQIEDQNRPKKHRKGDKHLRKDKYKNKKHKEQLPPLLDYSGWQDHIERKHFKNKSHKKLWIPMLFISVIFSFLGVCLAKCLRKCKKDKKRAMKKANLPKNSMQLQKQIKQVENKLSELRKQYNSKRNAQRNEVQMRSEQESAYRVYENELKQLQPKYISYPRAQNKFAVQKPYFPIEQIPVGRPIRPIIKSSNSSFASEYPPL